MVILMVLWLVSWVVFLVCSEKVRWVFWGIVFLLVSVIGIVDDMGVCWMVLVISVVIGCGGVMVNVMGRIWLFFSVICLVFFVFVV